MPTANGLGCDVVMGLMVELYRQGYHLFCDILYSSPKLWSDLFQRVCCLTGTVRESKIGFPKSLANPLAVKEKYRTARWFQEGQTVFLKWKDTKFVCVISSFYPATGRDFAEKRWGKLVCGRYVKECVNIPPAIKGYNANMGV